MLASKTISLALLLLAASVAWCQPVNPDIRINNVDGVNGAASGAPGNQAAVFLALGCSTVGASTTIQAPIHGMGGFPTDGSSALWLETGSGRRWTKVLGFPSGDTITVQDSFNIGVAVDCAMGGEISGTLANVTRLCLDLKAGWTVTLENTGVNYTDSGVCALTSGFTSTNTEGSIVIRGDDPDNHTPILYQTNGNYMTISNNIRVLGRDLHFIKDTPGGTAGSFASNVFHSLRGITVSNNQGTWADALSIPINGAGAVISSLALGPFTTRCMLLSNSTVVINNYMDGCSGSVTAFDSTSNRPLILFNILDQQGSTLPIFSGSVNGGFGGTIAYNTLLGGGGSGIVTGANFPNMISGNLIGAAALSIEACYTAGVGASNITGGSGEPHTIWQGNASDECPTARYAGGLETTSQGAASDINAGSQVVPLFADEAMLNYFPNNPVVKSSTVFPGSTFPLLTPALPVSTMTAGAAQRPGGAGVSAYAF